MRKVIFFIIGLITSVFTLAAEEIASLNLDINIDYSNDPFYSETWFWGIVGLLFFLLLLLLIFGGRTRKQSVEVPEKKEMFEQE